MITLTLTDLVKSSVCRHWNYPNKKGERNRIKKDWKRAKLQATIKHTFLDTLFLFRMPGRDKPCTQA